jgi:hypothetical protein
MGLVGSSPVIWTKSNPKDTRHYAIFDLEKIVYVMVYGAIAAVALLLALTARDFVQVVYQRPPMWLSWSVLAIPVVVSAISVGLAFFYRPMIRRRRTTTSPNRVAKSLSLAAFGTLLYGIGTPVSVGVLISLPNVWWSRPSPALVAISLTIGLIAPNCLLVVLALTVPPLNTLSADPKAADTRPFGSVE